MLNNIKTDIHKLANAKKAAVLQRFFKTGKGEYAEGDIFLGIPVPQQRKIAERYANLDFSDIKKLLHSKIHEYRLISLLILIKKFQQGQQAEQQKIYNFYLKNTKYINNWDLIDISAPKIVGRYLLNKPKKILFQLAKSPLIWERRIAILSTFEFIRHKELKPTLKISKILLDDKEDLIHKAAGWMLRETGKAEPKLLKHFLDKYLPKIPRTMLRYSIEKLPQKTRKKYLKK